MLYEERELSTDLFKANFKIAKLERDISSHKNRFKNELNRYRKALENAKKYIRNVCKEECGYTKKTFCGDCDCRYGNIFDIINKAKGTNND